MFPARLLLAFAAITLALPACSDRRSSPDDDAGGPLVPLAANDAIRGSAAAA